MPDVARLKRLLQSMAMLEAILEPEWEYRYYSFNAHWGEGEMMGTMRDGAGDEVFALFNSISSDRTTDPVLCPKASGVDQTQNPRGSDA